MTNVQVMLESAINAMNNGDLSSKDAEFVRSLQEQFGEDPTALEAKKALRRISSKQYDRLRRIASSV